MHVKFSFIMAGICLLFGSSAFGAEPSFGWPAACSLGMDCWIAQYVDHDPSASFRDFTCGHQTYDKHDGIDIALKDRNAMNGGVHVVAAADGRVVRMRDGMDDHYGTPKDIAAVKAAKKEGGNIVSLLHDDGWVTEYGHMKKGSVTVKDGQYVRKGDVLGAVGQSGMAQFAHVHFSVRHKNKTVDPFAGEAFSGCGGEVKPMWEKPAAYEPIVLFAAGFSDAEPDLGKLALDASSPPSLPVGAEKLLFWFVFYGAEPGDRLNLSILDPMGEAYAQNEFRQERRQARVYRMIGQRTAGAPLKAGTYTGRATVTRKGLAVREIEQTVIIRE